MLDIVNLLRKRLAFGTGSSKSADSPRAKQFGESVNATTSDLSFASKTAFSIKVVEPVNERNFNPEGYLLANGDLVAAKVDARDHYENFGKFESRQQISEQFLKNDDYRKRKYNLFKDIIIDPRINAVDKFPTVLGSAVYDLSEYQAESANSSFGPFEEEVKTNPEKLYLDLGCGLRDTVYENCLYLEVYNSLTADVIVDPSCTYPIKDQSLDGIGCFAVLEHTRMPWLVVSEIHRMLKPGGAVFIDWPFLQPIHGFPSHFFNASREGLVTIFEDAGFVVKRVGTESYQGPDHTISWILGHFVQSLPAVEREKFKGITVGQLINQPPQSQFWVDVLASLDDRSRSKFACGNTLFAVKSDFP